MHQDGGTYRKSWNKAETSTYWLNTARDGDGDGYACETAAGLSKRAKVVFGLGLASVYPQDSRHRIAAAAPDSKGILRATEFKNEEIRPLASMAYLFPPKEWNIRWGVMALVDAELFQTDNLARANGLGVGVLAVFRSWDDSDRDWSNAFGIGIAYMRDARAKVLRDDFILGSEAPRGSEGEFLAPEFIDTSGHSFLVVVTYSFGRRSRPDE